MPRLKRTDCSGPGIARSRRGRDFEYIRDDGRRVRDAATIKRIEELAIPPAWKEVWVCIDANGHIQATGIDAANRKQYLYHERWRQRRDREKFDDMVEFARVLPRLRKRVTKDLSLRGYRRERVLACAVRLLDRGFFRIGSEGYAEENQTYGVATVRRRHVEVSADTVTFDYEAKGGQRRVQVVDDPAVAKLIRPLRQRRGGGPELLAYKETSDWRDVRSHDINDYVKEMSGGEFTAKDFRTWNGTVLAAVALAAQAQERNPESKSARIRAKGLAVKEVARFLGNTPAVSRASYIDPRVFDRFDGGQTIESALQRLPQDPSAWPEVQGPIERAVLRLIASR